MKRSHEAASGGDAKRGAPSSSSSSSSSSSPSASPPLAKRSRPEDALAAAADVRVAEINYQTGVEHDTKKDMAVAVSAFRVAANLGHLDACFALGAALAGVCDSRTGATVTVQTETMEWYEKAHRQGHVAATRALANRFWFGTFGIPCDPQRAMECFSIVCGRAYPADAKYMQPSNWSEMALEHARGVWFGLGREAWAAGMVADPRRALELLAPLRTGAAAISARTQLSFAGMMLALCGPDNLELPLAALRTAAATAAVVAAASPRVARVSFDDVQSSKVAAALCVLTGEPLGPDASPESRVHVERYSRCSTLSILEAFLTRDVDWRMPTPLVRLVAAFACTPNTFLEAEGVLEFAERMLHRPADRVVLLRRAAELGSGHAQLTLGTLVHRGYGSVKGDPAAAMRWHVAAADQGIAGAANNAGLAFLSRTPPDAASTYAWFSRASAMGDAVGTYQLAVFFSCGHEGFPRDPLRALSLLRSAASQGYARAQNRLAFALEAGYATGFVDLHEAARLHYAVLNKQDKDRDAERAALSSVYNAGELALLHGLGRVPKQEMLPVQRASAAMVLWQAGAAKNEIHCCYRLGWAYATGTLGCEVSAGKALDWFERASRFGHLAAKDHLETRRASSDTPCLFLGHDYGATAERTDFPEISRLLVWQRTEAAARFGADKLSGVSFVWRDIEARPARDAPLAAVAAT